MAPPVGLLDDLIGEILLRLPPEDPEFLVRASLVCKPWLRLLSDPGFHRRYREFHRSPPLLGFVHNVNYSHCKKRKNMKSRAGRIGFARFVPIKEASPIVKAQPEPADLYIRDCRHGRVLFYDCKRSLIIWDPITNCYHHIGLPNINDNLYDFTAAVRCAMDACDHLACHCGPSLVVFVEVDKPFGQGASASAMVYSTETGTWNAGVSSVHLGPIIYPRSVLSKFVGSSLLAQDAIYTILEEGRRILKYDLAGCTLSVMSGPPLPVGNIVLMKAEGGAQRSCSLDGHSLHLWAWRTGPSGTSEWEKDRVIQLGIRHLSTKLDVVDFAEGSGSIFVRANNSFFAVELKSGQSRKIGEGGDFKDIFPFMSFYTPEILLAPDSKRE